MGPNGFNQTYTPTTTTALPVTNTISAVIVNDASEVDRFPIGPGNTVFFITVDRGTMFEKSCDAYGRMAPMVVYETKRQVEQQPAFVTWEAFDKAVDKKVNEILASRQRNNHNKKGASK